MPELQLQKIRAGEFKSRRAGVKGNGHVKIKWEELEYKEMTGLVERLAGPRPEVPEDISAPEWSPQAVKVLNERYFLKDKDGRAIENTQEMCWRVAWELARAEVKYGRSRKEIAGIAEGFYKLMLTREFLPNSPTLMNAGKNNGLQYSACYVIPVPDSLEGIFDGVKWQGLIHQSGGGTGFSFSRLRPKGARVKSTMGVASGPVSFMRIYNEATQQIKQGGTRRGANMGILRVDHPDVLEFIHCKDDNTGISNFNISVTVTDKFMEALAKDGDYDLVDPHNGMVTGQISARRVWNEIAESAWKTGDPGLVFIDRINHSPANPIRAEGWEVESTNPCGEQPLYPFDACNLGSIFLNYFVGEDRQFDWEKLRVTTRMAVRMLDDVIEMNPFPLPQIKETVMNIRRIGLGIGGWADMLVAMGIPYDSEEALLLAEKMMKFINAEGHKMSEELAAERGPFPLWRESIYKKPIRNSTVTTIAPTGTIGILANTSGGCEPLFAIAYQHIVKSENRTLNFVNPLFEKVARERGFYSQELMDKIAQHGTVREISEIPADVRQVFGTAHEIDPEWHVKTQAAFQKYTDNGVSKTINLRNDVTVDDVKKAYMLAWETECRGITVFRDGSKSEQVLNLGTKKSVQELASSVQEQTIKPRPVKVEGATYRIETPMGVAFVTVNHDSDGNPYEVFVTIGKAGSDLTAMAEAMGRLVSKFLKLPAGIASRERVLMIVDQLSGIGGARSVGFGANKVRSLPDAVAKALRMHFGLIGAHDNGNGNGKQEEAKQEALPLAQIALPVIRKADICPSCGEGTLVFEEGCKKCYGCGYSEC